MPSDTRVQLALEALAKRRAVYRAAMQSSLARVRALLAANGGAERARLELGVVGALHIDAARFADLSHAVALDSVARARLTRAADVLESRAEEKDSDYVVHVAEGRAPGVVIAAALGRWGAGFGSALASDLVRVGQYVASRHDSLTDVFRFEQWSQAHRLAAPPVVAVVAGSDLRVADLTELLDGAQHIVLVVEGDCAPAPLIRHITPGTLVLQTADETGLARFAAFDGPAIAALVPESAACFLHDPEAGAALWQRLTIWRRPAQRPRATRGGLSAAQQKEELLQLEAIAAQPTLSLTAVEALVPAGTGAATDRLASWLLSQSGAV